MQVPLTPPRVGLMITIEHPRGAVRRRAPARRGPLRRAVRRAHVRSRRPARAGGATRRRRAEAERVGRRGEGRLVSLPINFLGREFAEAQLRIVEPTEEQGATIPLHFNPSEYKLKKENTFAEVPIPGLESPPLQYVRGGARTLTMDVLVDTSDELSRRPREVRRRRSRRCVAKNEKLHAPPIVEFVWAEQVFRGVLQSLEVNYVLFHSDGKPLRAKLSLSLKEYRPVEVQAASPSSSPPPTSRSAMSSRGRGDAQLDLRRRLPRPRPVARDRGRQRDHRPAPDRARHGADRPAPRGAERMSTDVATRTSGSPDNYYAPDFSVEVEGKRAGREVQGRRARDQGDAGRSTSSTAPT